MTNHIQNWIPYKINFQEDIKIEWIYLGDKYFKEPFFDETLMKCKSLQENSKGYKIVSNVNSLIEWSKQINSIALNSLIFHISRCGSTLISQALCETDINIVISEAPILDQILFSDRFTDDQKELVFKSVIKFLGVQRFEYQQYFIIKCDAWHLKKIDLLRKYFPETPFFMLYRNPREVLNSHQLKRGMHMIPGLLEPNVFNFQPNQINIISLTQYGDLVLSVYLQCIDEFKRNDSNNLALSYNTGMQKVIKQFINFTNLKYSENIKIKIINRLKTHSKYPDEKFKGDNVSEFIFENKLSDKAYLKLNK